MSLFTVRHVFGEFVEGMESGIRNPESGTGSSQPFSFCYLWEIISHLQHFFVSLFFFKYRILSLRGLLSLLQALGGFPIQTVAAVERCLNLNILLLNRRYLKLINYDSRTAQQCKCEVSICHFNLILLSLLSLFFLVFSFLSVIFGLSEKRTILA